MKSTPLIVSLLLTPLVAGCGSTSAAVPDSTDATSATPNMPSTLTCPSGELVETAGGFLAEVPEGYETREQAVRAWLEESEWAPADADFIITEDGKSAWVLRQDGTALARVGFIGDPGFSVYNFEACSD